MQTNILRNMKSILCHGFSPNQKFYRRALGNNILKKAETPNEKTDKSGQY